MTTIIRFKQAILIRRDLRMRRGKEIAQAAHAAIEAYKRALVRNRGYVDAWEATGTTKVGLQVDSEESLVRLYQQALDAKLPASLITDSGRTEFNGVPTKTAVAIGPAPAHLIDEITGHLELY